MGKSERRQEKLQRRKEEREAHESSEGTRRFWGKIAGITGGALALMLIFIGWNSGFIQTHLLGSDAASHPYAPFAQCLADEGLVMYGTDWCPYCNEQRNMFEEAFEFIEYVNCDFNQTTCQSKGVTGYPTWFLDGSFWKNGVQNFYTLAEATGCELPDEF